jgi:hypothetical protein
MGARGGLEPDLPERPERPDPACLPLAPETDVLTTLPIVMSRAASGPAGPGATLARRADPLERLGTSVASPLLAGEGLARDGAGAGEQPGREGHIPGPPGPRGVR